MTSSKASHCFPPALAGSCRAASSLLQSSGGTPEKHSLWHGSPQDPGDQGNAESHLYFPKPSTAVAVDKNSKPFLQLLKPEVGAGRTRRREEYHEP